MSNNRITDDMDVLLNVLPDSIARVLRELGRPDELIEVVLDLGRRPEARFVSEGNPDEGEQILRQEEAAARTLGGMIEDVTRTYVRLESADATAKV